MDSSPSVASRSEAFGTRTRFRTRLGEYRLALLFRLLRAVKPERDARTLKSLHFAYWVIVPRKRLAQLTALRRAAPYAQPAPDQGQLLFLSDFSGDWELYLEGFNRVLRVVLDAVWRDAEGWTLKMGLAPYLKYVGEHELKEHAYAQAYGGQATVVDVQHALRVSEALDRFVLETEGLDSKPFAAAFKQLRIALGPSLAA